MPEHHDLSRTIIDAVSMMTMLGTLMDKLPAIAALFTVIWTAIRIFETDTVQKLLGRGDAGQD
jgi:hypothetical protein